VAISGCRSLLESPGDSRFVLAIVVFEIIVFDIAMVEFSDSQ